MPTRQSRIAPLSRQLVDGGRRRSHGGHLAHTGDYAAELQRQEAGCVECREADGQDDKHNIHCLDATIKPTNKRFASSGARVSHYRLQHPRKGERRSLPCTAAKSLDPAQKDRLLLPRWAYFGCRPAAKAERISSDKLRAPILSITRARWISTVRGLIAKS